jgi:D-lactate dehydrogenase
MIAHENRYGKVYDELRESIPAARLFRDPLTTLAYGTDASFYRLIPKIVVRVLDEQELIRVLRVTRAHAVPVTFRAAGTSLSGQAITDSVLVALDGHGWRGYHIGDKAATISLEPGIIGAHANTYLAPFGKKIGPDPASINAAKIGGIAANNASGMCCGTAQNSYRTLQSMRLVLADGTRLDTATDASREAFRTTHGDLLERLDELGRGVRANADLAALIRRKFAIKNTTGYSLNALVDFEDPFEILQHLMIGSEGTLGFISEITFRTVEEHPHKASALPVFPDIRTACEAVAILKQQPVAAVELMDRASLRSVEGMPGIPDDFADLSETAAALLIETRAADANGLARNIATVRNAIAGVETVYAPAFTDKVEEYAKLWNVRKGLFPAVGSARETGTTVIIEDIAFAIDHLAPAVVELQGLFRTYGYDEAIVFGHALEGNIHFVITQAFETPEQIEHYAAFIRNVCTMVTGTYGGSLKAEHGTGRNMAPFVEMEWGAQAYALMQDIKAIFDPDGLLNPGVILNQDPEVHLKHLKVMRAVDPLVDTCIECGFCEPNCPSRDLSLTPRQRIATLRELSQLEASGEDQGRLIAIRDRYGYLGIDTCAADGLCALACPVGIDTGVMMKHLRARTMGRAASGMNRWLADRYGAVGAVTRVLLRIARAGHTLLGTQGMAALTQGLRALSGQRMPLWNPLLPGPSRMPRPSQHATHERPRVVYFPCCVSRMMGPARGDAERDPLPVKVTSLLEKAGYQVVLPDNCGPLCCGQPWESKGMPDLADRKTRELKAALIAASREGRAPIVFDTSPCVLRVRDHHAASFAAAIYDLAEFLHDHVLEHLEIERQPGPVAVHPVCSTRKMDLEGKLIKVAEACAERVVVPLEVTCCGWSGDRGFSFPELSASALHTLRASLPEGCEEGWSTSRTCEIGLSLHSARPYRSIAYLLDRVSRPKAAPPQNLEKQKPLQALSDQMFEGKSTLGPLGVRSRESKT